MANGSPNPFIEKNDTLLLFSIFHFKDNENHVTELQCVENNKVHKRNIYICY